MSPKPKTNTTNKKQNQALYHPRNTQSHPILFFHIPQCPERVEEYEVASTLFKKRGGWGKHLGWRPRAFTLYQGKWVGSLAVVDWSVLFLLGVCVYVCHDRRPAPAPQPAAPGVLTQSTQSTRFSLSPSAAS